MLMKVGSRSPILSGPAPARSGPVGVVRPPADLDATLPIGQAARLRPAPEVLVMRCLRCQGPVEKGTAPVRVERNGYRLAWEDVPAWVCSRCELAYFEPGEVESIRNAVQALRSLEKI